MFDIFQGGFGTILLLGIVGFGLVAIAGFAAVNDKSNDPMSKLKEQVQVADTAKPAKPNASLRRKQSNGLKVLEKYAKFLEPEDAKELSAAQQRMIQAGYYGKHAVRDFQALQFILAVGLLLLSLLVVFVIAPDNFESTPMRAAAIIIPMLIGYYGPRKWIDGRVEARKEEILSGFPDALDMLLICVEAGQSLDQSIQRVATEMKNTYPALSEEFTTVGEQVKAGRERSEVLKDLAKRCDISDITSFTTVMIQAATYGTSITDALRVFAAEMRDKRIMRAEEKANILPTKMTLGTMMFTVPPLLIILIGPSIVGIVTELNSSNISGM
ncbi:MAG: Tad secretion system assembly platform protein TadC [Roseibaca calidilacus]|uniref:Tad secretion system assembly platform protein TadC n=1 Tax=Roseibaca calidilacus TaxID=1666912 RepID=A0A0P8ADT5_9RHOB|nr:type II secretion system F family protein [Roseibaca calidilacus]KPP92382.1 MAG: Tad secretion system assembly platform protein TadC [Roseibaca calidilacus]CUX79677.1 tight adherence protein C [Roseibaca calidilacus]